MTEQSTTLSIKRIIITVCYFLIVPIVTPLLNMIINNELVSYTFAVNLSGLLILIQNWDLLALHAKRLKEDVKESIFFFFVGIILITGLFYLNSLYLHAFVPIIDIEQAQAFSLFNGIFFLAHSFVFALIYVVTFKCVTDRLKLKHAEIVVILLSGFLFALLFTVTYIPFDLIAWLKGYLFYFVITLVISYLYNQTRSFLPGMIGLAVALFIINLLTYLHILL